MHRALESLVNRGRLSSQHLSEGIEQEILHGVLDAEKWRGSIQELIPATSTTEEVPLV